MKNTDDVAIFWDFENCNAPYNASGYLLASNVAALARPFGTIKQFRAYLEITEQAAPSRFIAQRSELQSSGVSLIDCPHNGRKEVADKMLIVDMMAYAIDNPAPSTLVVITGDRDVAYALATLKLRWYRLVLITLPNAHASLTCQASICFDWFSDVVNPANASPPLGVPSGQSSRHQPRKSSDFAALQGSLSPIKPRHVSDSFEFACEGYSHDVDINDYIPSRERASTGTFLDINTDQKAVQIDGPPAPGRSAKSKKRSSPKGSPKPVNNEIQQPESLRPGSAIRDNIQRVSKLDLGLDFEARLAMNSQPLSPSHDTPLSFSADASQYVGPSITESSPATTTSSLTSSDCDVHPLSTGIEAISLNNPGLVQLEPPTIAPALLIPFVAPSATSSRSESDSAIIPLATELGTVSGISSNPTLVPLVDLLNDYQLKGQHKPLRSVVGLELAKQGNVYRKAGVASFKAYVALAEKEGLVNLGGRDGYAWITLRK